MVTNFGRLLRRAAALAASFALLIPGKVFAENGENAAELSGVKSCALAEMNSLTVIAEKEGDERRDVAGLSMLPALLYVCEAFDGNVLDADTEITVSEEAAGVKGPTAFLRPHESIGAGLLLKAAVMITAGDAVTALAEAAAGTEKAAVAAINQNLARLGIEERCDSLYAPDLLFSAKELLVIGKALLCSESFLRFSAAYLDGIVHENGEKTELVNRNRLLLSVNGCMGVATGSSDAAGYCGVFAVKRGETAYLCAVTGAENADVRFETARMLIEHAFASYQVTKVVSSGEKIAGDISVRGGVQEKTDLIARKDAVLFALQGETYTRQLQIPDVLAAPLFSNRPEGKLLFVDGKGKTVCEILLYPSRDIPAAGFFDRVGSIMSRWVSG